MHFYKLSPSGWIESTEDDGSDSVCAKLCYSFDQCVSQHVPLGVMAETVTIDPTLAQIRFQKDESLLVVADICEIELFNKSEDEFMINVSYSC